MRSACCRERGEVLFTSITPVLQDIFDFLNDIISFQDAHHFGVS